MNLSLLNELNKPFLFDQLYLQIKLYDSELHPNFLISSYDINAHNQEDESRTCKLGFVICFRFSE